MDELIGEVDKLERQISEAKECLNCSPLDYPFRVIDNITKILSDEFIPADHLAIDKH
jgi:hypothetical protein